MGRKGVSKRKPGKTKSKPFVGGAASGSVSSSVQAAESQPIRAIEPDKAAPATKGGGKPFSDGKKGAKKG